MLYLPQILTTNNESEPTFSCSTVKFLFWCLEDTYLQSKWEDSGRYWADSDRFRMGRFSQNGQIFSCSKWVTNLLYLRHILTSDNESELVFSCSTVKFLFWCLQDIYLQNKWADSGGWKSSEIIVTADQRRLFHTLFHRSFSICCDFKTFHLEIDNLRTILRKNNFPLNFIDFCIHFRCIFYYCYSNITHFNRKFTVTRHYIL